MSKLFTPLNIKSVTLRNRIVVSPMCQYSSVNGFANDWHLVHLGSRAVGGAGLIITEACAVSPEGRISPYDLGIWKDEHVAELKRINAFIEAHGSVPGIQLAHAGRKASSARPADGGQQLSLDNDGWQTVGPSAVPFKESNLAPVALDKAGIAKVITDFKNATRRSMDAGFKVIELHAAHGYLVHQFLSPLSNFRKDEYGGSFENRIRLLLEMIEGVQTIWPSTLPLFVRISATDWTEGGWTVHDSVKLASILKEKGVDLIDCSTGGNVQAKIPLGPGYQVPYADAVKKGSGILTGAVGLITDAKQAEDILEKEQADVIIMARELLRDPYFPIHAADQLGDSIQWAVQYERARK